MQTTLWDVSIYEAGSCSESLKGVGWGLKGGWDWAPLHLTPIQNLQKFLTVPNPQNAFQVSTEVPGNLSVLALFSYIKLNFGQARLLFILRIQCIFLPMEFCSLPSCHMEYTLSPTHKILLFLENQVKWCLFCDV